MIQMKRTLALLLCLLLLSGCFGGVTEQEIEMEFQMEESTDVLEEAPIEEKAQTYPAYVRLLEETQASNGKLASGSIVLALSATEALCAVNGEKLAFAYNSAEFLTPEETEDALREIISAPCYMDDPNYPLLEVELVQPLENTPLPEATEEIPVLATVEPTAVPEELLEATSEVAATEEPVPQMKEVLLPTRVEVANPVTQLGVGQVSLPMDVKVFSDDEEITDEYTDYTFKSSSTKYVTITENGCLKAVRAGTATITVTTRNGVKASFKVKVVSAPKSITISPKKATIAIGQTTGKFTYKLTSKTMASVTYSSSDESILTVQDDGTVKPQGEGTATVTVRTHNGKQDTAEVKVNPAPTECSITFSKTHIGEKASAQASMQCNSTSSLRFSAVWTSQTPENLTIDEKSGKITALKEGTGVVRVALEGYDVFREEEITVVPGPDTIEVKNLTPVMLVGNSMQLPVDFTREDGRDCDADYTIVSKSPKIVSVSGTTLKALKAGKATITVSAAGCADVDVVVTVYNKPSKIVLNQTSRKIYVDNTFALETKVYYSSKSYRTYTVNDGAGVATFTSSNPAIATVDADGNITAVGKGTADITVKSGTKKAVCKVDVWVEATDVTITPAEITLGEGMTQQLSASFPDHEDTSKLTCSSSDKDKAVAVIDENGKVTAKGVGKATITVRTAGNIERYVSVTVLPGPDVMNVDRENLILCVKQSFKLPYTAELFDGTPTPTLVTYSTSDKKVATVDQSGKITAVAVGTADITVTASNGKSATCRVEVLKTPTSVRFNATVGYLYEGQVYNGLEATVKASGRDVKWTQETAYFGSWSSSNKAVVSITDGVLTAGKAGTATITFKTYNGKKATCKVTVYKMPDWIALDGGVTTNMFVGDDLTLPLHYAFFDKNNKFAPPFELTSSNTEVVGVETSDDKKSYRVHANGVGTAELYLVGPDGKNLMVQTIHVRYKPIRASFAKESESLTIGLHDQMSMPELTVYSEQGKCDAAAYYTLDNNNVKIVDGKIIAEKVGKTVITAKIDDCDVEATCKVTVLPEPTTVSIAPDQEAITEGDTFTLSVEPDTVGSYEITTENTSVLQLDGNQCTALKSGTAVVRVTMYNGVEGTCRLTVRKKPKALRFEARSLEMSVGESMTPTVIRAESMLNEVVSFAISPEGIAMVTPDGMLTAIGTGTATLRISSESMPELFDEIPVTVKNPDTAIHLGVGETLQLQSDVSVTTGETVVSIDETGLLTAQQTGTATVQTQDGILTIVVHEAPAELAFAEERIVLGCGQTYDLGLSYEGKITYTSSDGTKADVDTSGIITAKSVGETTITATTYNGLQDSLKVCVVAAPTEMSIVPNRFVGCMQDTVTFTLETTFEGTDVYTWATSDESVAQIAHDGTLTFTGIGEADITVTAYNGLTATAAVTCKETPLSMSFGMEAYTMLTNCSAKPQIVFDRGSALFTLSSDNPDVLRIAADGITLEPLMEGTATLTATAEGCGLTATCVITVVDEIELTAVLTENPIEVEEETVLTYDTTPSNLLVEGIAFESDVSSVAEVDKNGTVTGIAYGETTLKVCLPNGQTAEAALQVLGGKRRMMIAYYWADKGIPGYLPFTRNEAYSMKDAFGATTVEGQKYAISGPYKDLRKSSLAQQISSTFADADDNDVSFIYIVCHGVKYGPAGEYSLQMPNNEYMSAHELMAPIRGIKGRVVLMLVSCRSGGFIEACEGILNRENGRIAVLTSSGSETTSSFWTAATEAGSVDFYTYSVLHALGYNASTGKDGIFGDFEHTFLKGLLCDENGNGNDKVEVEELYNYAAKFTGFLLDKKAGNKSATIAKGQTPRAKIGSACTDLVLYES